jgi:hypothetical protein
MKGGSPAYDYHQSEGFLSNESFVDHVKPLTYFESGPVEGYDNLYQISGGGVRRRRRGQRTRRAQTKSNRNRKRCGRSVKSASRTKRCSCTRRRINKRSNRR